MMREQFTVVTRKGQITIPAEIRKALGLRIGDRVAISLDEDGQLHAALRPVAPVADSTFGSIRSAGTRVDEEELREAFADHATARDERSKRT